MMAEDREELWLSINDSDVAAADLVQQVEERWQQRPPQTADPTSRLPAFGSVAPLPPAPAPDSRTAALHFYLRQVNELAPLATEPELAPSPATRLPVAGRLWQMLRGEAHRLILFYVNRLAAHAAAREQRVLSVLNELATVVQEQEEEIRQLRAAPDQQEAE